MRTQTQDTRSHILTTGRRLTAQRGYGGVGLSVLLKEAGVPKGSFYHYFPSKEAYGCALLKDFMRQYQDRLGETLLHPTLSGRDRFMAYFHGWLRKQTSPAPEDRCLVVKLSAEVADLSPDMSRILQSGVENVIAQLADVLQQGVQDGSISPLPDPQAMATLIYHQWLGASLIAGLANSDAPLRAAIDTTEGLIPPP